MNPAEFDNIARAERDFWWYRGMREILYRLLDRFPIGPGASVLEAGCGTGYMSKLLTERYGWRMTPLDLGREGLEYARGYGLDRLVQGDISALPFKNAAFDGLVSMDVIVHLPRGKEGAALREFARVVKPGGLLALRVSALDALHSRHSEFVQERQRFTRPRLKQAVEAAGFRVDRVTYVNFLLLPVSLFKFRVWEPLTQAPAASAVAAVPGWLDRLLFVALRAEAGWVGSGGGFPAGQSLVLIGRRR
jgi:ubiquinone/menaquinone biosynthesis C-methylase UbiE